MMLAGCGNDNDSAPNPDIEQLLATSLHGTRVGKDSWYNDNDGFSSVVTVNYSDLPCADCHNKAAWENAGETWSEPNCLDCHENTPGDAVAEPHRKYTGETRAPLILQNSHRWFFYAGLVFNVILTYDAILGFRNADGEWGHMGLGTVFLLTNATLLWLYSLSCHSCRHAVGGRLKSFSKHPMRYWAWTWVSRLNTRHPLFAWLSLFGVAFADFYVRMLAAGTISDPTFF
jgi:hypothetical protein